MQLTDSATDLALGLSSAEASHLRQLAQSHGVYFGDSHSHRGACITAVAIWFAAGLVSRTHCFLEMFIDPVCSVMSFLQGAVVLVVAFGLYWFAIAQLQSPDVARALAFVTLVAGNVGLVLVNRSWHVSAFGALVRRNVALWIAVGITTTILTALFVAQQTRALFHFALPPIIWLLSATALGFAVTLWFDVLKASGKLRAMR